MTFSIDPQIFELYPDLVLGVIIAKGIENTGEKPEVLQLLQAEQEAVKARLDVETYKDDERLLAWREAYRAFGAKPKKHSCSIENLYRMVLKGIELGHINTVVDIYNAMSLKYGMPMGGDDLDHVDGDIVLTRATGDEPFTVLNGDEVDHPKEGEVIYRDDKEVLCRRWNWRECDKSKMTEQSTNVSLVLEGLPPVGRAEIDAALNELAGLVEQHCGGTVESFVLDRDQTSVSWT